MSAGAGDGRSLAEWVTLALSLLVIGTLVTVAVMEQSRLEQQEGPGLTVIFDADHATRRGDSYVIPYAIRNTGSEAITSAEIWFDVLEGATVVESAEIRVAFLPLQGTQRGIFVTTHDPARYALRDRLESLQIP
ncbi:MAG: hypothetical protein IT338_12430 [Thermomicrobiales bacterium]|nr:hypothetical protein [Thermomicrobiales bacterium]